MKSLDLSDEIMQQALSMILQGEAPSERFSIGWNRPIEKKTLQINKLEHVLIRKVDQLF